MFLMASRRFPAWTLLLILILSGCMGSSGKVGDKPQAVIASTSETPRLAPTLSVWTPPAATASPTMASTPSLSVNLEAVGDINLARTVGQEVLSSGSQVVFSGVEPAFDTADVLVGNLECAITSGGIPQKKKFTFDAPPETAQALSTAGFDVLSLANNHAMDYGSAGLLDTLKILDTYGIAPVGAGSDAAEAHSPVILVRNGLRLAFLAYADVSIESDGFDTRSWIAGPAQPGIAWADIDQMSADIAAAKDRADVVIVFLHFGYEISTILPNVSAYQQQEARAAIDAGATLVIGSHPHFLQPIERYHGGLIAYSLGNFVFDDYLGVANATIILRVVLTPSGIQEYDWVPVLIESGLPVLIDLNKAPAIGTLVAPRNP
jgi:poly-gamma-glutamate capsule biosynthesis protein CapA/YwtB (metallophosphatase superfamily)